MTTPRQFARVGALLLLLAGLASPAGAEEPGGVVPLGTVEREVVGWTGTGGELIVRTVAHGERMVDGVSKDFYFRLTELRDPSGGAPIEAYRYGEASGAEHPRWAGAKSAADAEEYLQTVGETEATRQWHSPGGNYALTSYQRTTYGTVENVRGTQHVCRVRQRLLLIHGKDDRTYVVEEWTEQGEPASRKENADCPRVDLQAWWHPGSLHWAVVRRVERSSAQLRPPEVYAGNVIDVDDAPEAAHLPPHRPLADWVGRLENDTLRSGYRSLHDGQLAAATDAFQSLIDADETDEPTTIAARYALARVLARADKERPAESQSKQAWRASDKGFLDHALMAAINHHLGDEGDFERQYAAARSDASGHAEFVQMAELFRFYDVSVANDLILRALGQPDADPKSAAYRESYSQLIEGLIDAEMYDEAKMLLGKLDALSPRLTVQEVRARMDRSWSTGEAVAPDETAALLDEHPGVCLSYLLHGRALARDGRPAEASRQFRAAAICAPHLPEAHFYRGALAIQRQDGGRAAAPLKRFLQLAAARRNDPVRTRRRDRATGYLARLDHTGVVLRAVACQTQSYSGLICRVVLENTRDEEQTGITVRARRQTDGETIALASRTVEALDAGETTTVALRPGGRRAGVVIEAGRDDEEMRINRTPITLD